MKRPFSHFSQALSAAAVCALLSMTPAFAQAADNAGDLHHHKVSAQQHKSLRGYTASVSAPEADQAGCGLIHDFNTSASHYQYIAVCPLR